VKKERKERMTRSKLLQMVGAAKLKERLPLWSVYLEHVGEVNSRSAMREFGREHERYLA